MFHCPGHKILPGQLFRLYAPRQYCAAPKAGAAFTALALGNPPEWFNQLQHDWKTYTPEQKESFISLSSFMLGTGGAALTTIEKTFINSVPIQRELVALYEDYKAGKYTKGQYTYRRRKLLAKFESHMGPLRAIAHGRKSATEVLRMTNSKSVAAIAPVTQQIAKVRTLSKVASRGGVALGVVGLGIACSEIARTEDRHKKNEILVESVGGFASGLIYGFGAAVFLVSTATPVGWVGALVVGAGGALAGYGGCKAAKKIYNLYGQEIDISGAIGVTAACSAGSGRAGSKKNYILSDNALSLM